MAEQTQTPQRLVFDGVLGRSVVADLGGLQELTHAGIIRLEDNRGPALVGLLAANAGPYSAVVREHCRCSPAARTFRFSVLEEHLPKHAVIIAHYFRALTRVKVA